MFALVESGSITKTLNGNRGITIGDVQYPQNIFTLWSAAEKEAIGIYEVVWDNTNKKDEAYYINTSQSFAFAGGAVTASYGSPTAKAIDDVLFTAQDEDRGLGTEGELHYKGLKNLHKETIKQQAAGILQDTDWYIVRKADTGTAVPSAITTYRAAVRTKSGQMETAIDNAADVDALATLYKYVNTGTEENPVMERPLGEFPEAV
jgi:hypothetical protein